MIKALFFDIDGTLVSFKTHDVPQSAIVALTAAKKKGIKIFISSGRPKVIMNNLGQLEERGLIDGYVSMNGAYCFVGDEVIDQHHIPHASAVAIARYAEHEKVPCIFVGAHDIKVHHCNKMVEEIFYNHLHVNKIEETTIEEATSQRLYQITPFINQKQEDYIVRQVSGCSGERWHPAFTDITATGCDKRHGVELMAQHFGIEQNEVMCFGDGGNDISMLQYAAIGVAMGNAEDFVKQEADYITDAIDNDGVYNALLHFGII